MWISKKKYQALEKRIADLEVQVWDQQKSNSEDVDGLIRQFEASFKEHFTKSFIPDQKF